jgi:protocatechuate 4,5-dioxygenase, alpha chain
VSEPREYDDIPGTFVFDSTRSRMGYRLNMFCMSLIDPDNREAFRRDEDHYLQRYSLSPEQHDAVRGRQWIRMLELGGNIYYTAKLAACDGMSFQQVAAAQAGVTEDQYVAMMVAGGRPIQGNRSRRDTPNPSSGDEVSTHG